MNYELWILNYLYAQSNSFNIQHSNKKYCLLSPQFAPNVYDFISMLMADTVIWLDEVPWSRKGRSHRSLLISGDNSVWTRIPVMPKDRSKAMLELRIDQTKKWTGLMLKQVESTYSQLTYYDYLEPEFSALVQRGKEFEYLVEWNQFFLGRVLDLMEVSLSIQLQSDVGLPDRTSFFEWDSKNYLPQPNKRLVHDFLPEGYRADESMLHLFFALGPEFFKLADQILKQHGRIEV
jgi:hypothetical protein